MSSTSYKCPEISVWFVLSGENLDPDLCTETLGIKPDKVWTQPAITAGTQPPRREWNIGFRRHEHNDIGEAIELVLARVWDKRDLLASLVAEKGYRVTVACNVTLWKDRPLYELTENTIQRLAALGASFGLDIFPQDEE